MSVWSDSSGCGGNTDATSEELLCFWSLLPLFESMLHLPPPLCGEVSLLEDSKVTGWQSGPAAWGILTVAKVFWMVSWPLWEFTCWMLGDDMECVECVKSQDYLVSHQWARQSALSLAVWVCWWLQATFVIKIWPASCWISLCWTSFKSSAKRNLAKTPAVYRMASF